MKVEAIKVENGFLIPFNETLEKIKEDKILLEVEIIEPNKLEEGYTILDKLQNLRRVEKSPFLLCF